VKKSRFLCDLRRVETEADARTFVESIRKQHFSARHHCTAFVIGPDSALQRSNDDGEPAGTAGAPMLEVLTRRGVSDVVAVVTRWFGGTLLGAGGLVRAYGESVGLALDAAGVRRREQRHVMTVTIDAAGAGVLDNRLRALGEVTGVAYGAEAVFTVAAVDPIAFAGEVARASAGRAVVDQVGTAWVDV